MNNQYEFFEQSLTPSIAQKLIQESFAGQTAKKQQILETVDKFHSERGGERSTATGHHPVTLALSAMKRSGLAKNPKHGSWFILPQIKTLSDFVEWTAQFRYKNYVFRGVSNASYKIEASATRGLKEKEGRERTAKHLKIIQEMVEDARVQGHGEKDGTSLSDLDLLAELQHREARTCLIDFSRNPLVALWMACRQGASGNADGKVSVVDISNQLTFQSVDFDSSQKKKIGDFFEWDERKGYQLFHWQPKYQSSRMLAQQSIFLFGGAEIEAATECVILENSKRDIRTSLENAAGITEMTLFPDFEGFTRYYTQYKARIESDPQDYLTRSLDAFSENNIDAAIEYCTQGISLHPPDDDLLARLHVNRAFGHLTKGEFNLAIQDYNNVIELGSDNIEVAEIYYWRGIAKSELSQYKEAVADYDEAIRLKPDYVSAYYNRGIAKYTLDQNEEAIADYDAVIRLNPDESGAYNNRGNAKDELERYEEAIADYDKAIDLDTDDARIYSNRGNAKAKLERYEEAIADYDKAIDLDTDNARIYSNRGNAKDELERYEEAIADYDKAIDLEPNRAEVYNNRGNAKAKLERYEEAIADYDKAIDLDTDDARIYSNRGNAKAKLERYEEAIADYDKAIDLDTDKARSYNNRGNAKAKLERYEEAIADFDKAIDLEPDDAWGYNTRGITYFNTDDFESAIEDFNKAIDLAPEEAGIYSNRGEAWLHLEEWQKARADLTTAKDMGYDIIESFQNDYESVEAFEAKTGIKLPEDIAALLSQA